MGPVRTWGPDFLFKLSNVMSDLQLKKNLPWGFHGRGHQRPTVNGQASKQADADIVLALRPESRPTEIAPEARQADARS